MFSIGFIKFDSHLFPELAPPGCRSTSRTLRIRLTSAFGFGDIMVPWYPLVSLGADFSDRPQSLLALFPFIAALSVAYSLQNLRFDTVVAPNQTVSMKRGT